MRASEGKTLDDVCEFIVDCLHATAPVQEDGFPLIRTPNIGRGRLLLDGVYRVSEDTYAEWTRRAKPETDDLILAREAPAGNVAIVKNGQTVCLGQRTVHLRVDAQQVDPDFLCYFLLAPPQQGLLLAGETGATAKHVNMKDIRRLPLRKMPSIESQRRAGRILAAYDDLIENNRRRIQLLEQAARLLYKEWFVLLRFPGHEHTQIIDGVPEGWRRTSLGDLCILRAGDTFKPKYQGRDKGDLPFIKVRDLNRGGNTIAITGADNWVTLDDCNEFRGKPFSKGTSVFAKIGEGLRQNRIRLINRDTLIDNNMMGAIPDQHVTVSEFLYFLLQGHDLASYAGGAAVPFLSSKVLEGVGVLAPPMRLLLFFQDAVAPMFQQIVTLELQSTAAAKGRDLLLPKLMNGEVAV